MTISNTAAFKLGCLMGTLIFDGIERAFSIAD